MIGRVLFSETDDLYSNLAVEQAILHLHSQRHDIMTLRFWTNPKSVVVGRSQEIHKEIDEKFCAQHGILIGRRISGGGTVYQDKGNRNISFFTSRNMLPKGHHMREITLFFTDLLIKSLKRSGISELNREGASNIFYKGLKVSGAAGYYRGDWILHHASLLLSANLKHLNKSLLAKPSTPITRRGSRAFPSTNLPPFDLKEWQTTLKELVEETFNITLMEGILTMEEEALAKKLRDRMYSKQSWIREKRRILISHNG